jgi:hypothetical protein
LVEQLIRNQQVSGSNPLNGSRFSDESAPGESRALFAFWAANLRQVRITEDRAAIDMVVPRHMPG